MYVPAAEVEYQADGTFIHNCTAVTRRGGRMGKSKKNSVGPDDMYASYGADTLRLYEMAMGPLDADRPWHTDDVVGVYRFLQRLWRSLVDERTGELIVDDGPADADTARLLHQTIRAGREHYAERRFNIALARLQELGTLAGRLVAARGRLPRAIPEPVGSMGAALAPHLAEEIS